MKTILITIMALASSTILYGQITIREMYKLATDTLYRQINTLPKGDQTYLDRDFNIPLAISDSTNDMILFLFGKTKREAENIKSFYLKEYEKFHPADMGDEIILIDDGDEYIVYNFRIKIKKEKKEYSVYVYFWMCCAYDFPQIWNY